MNWTSLNVLREQYLSFFESKGHTRLESASLIPKDDPSLLLTNAGMAPLKKYFTGEAKLPGNRACSCQKCIRTPDIERVGKTSRHGTFFEMLGNFSFGDYFKKEATAWAWEFCTKVLELPVDKLYVSVFESDDEAYDIWTQQVGVAPDHMVRLGREDNFWEHGKGPCGPCSEIYFDRGPEKGCGKPDCHVGCDCDRYVEFWNLVFTQFDSDGAGHYAELKSKNIDTGMGLERIACIMQGVDNLFEVDTIKNIMAKVSEIAGVKYHENEKSDVSLRVITDHIRSTVFMLADGVTLSNEGRGYVLRRLLRRAARHGKLLGINEPFLYKICDTVAHESGGAYPVLIAKNEYIKDVIKSEEERFAETIDKGLELLDGLTAENGVISGADAFRLYDTYGFPLDLTVDILAERGMTVDTDGFDALMKEQKERARAARSSDKANSWEAGGSADSAAAATEFLGYETTETEATVLAVREQEKGAIIVLDRTPFYAESGGQVGDTGVITGANGSVKVTDCRKTPNGGFLHFAESADGIAVGDKVTATVDKDRRDAIRRNHSSAHLLQAALRAVLGDHISQAGSYVDEHRMRFDFTHNRALTPEQIEQVEAMVNAEIGKALPVNTEVMSIEQAKQSGAIALFDEKYGDSVRVVAMGDFSKEFCGGTHVANTSEVGSFRIVSETAVAAGVRRIEAATGFNVLALLKEKEAIIAQAEEILKSGAKELLGKLASVVEENKRLSKELAAEKAKSAASGVDGLLAKACEKGGCRLLTEKLGEIEPDALRTIGDALKDKCPDIVAVLVGENGGKSVMSVVCGSEAVKKGANAGAIVKKLAAICGGGGGGRPDSAMAGIRDVSKLDEAFKAALD
ncbi:MAG: alanine--tRNA ligase [Clostridia bacterium]|nr:alanine--tRNA ligase [Clostridia bacterium]